ncbi:uncharacterized protein LOC129762231 [Toxorhynchites rutilus septentrionalis]|uniref:uncharacterized protein LOC129762231 n=1 Tax=Toxorhynchites rutilus septentrionalis TaxID=329112 RepID=UPI00247895D0|nr:uncharacterized protein LOC129762231 [Toxorhynchites rutilus septentrionalis]XP_055616276.1 uncharacterized protein LOC129762231 [Toxorhynchites rutilus septentrionalis]
MNTHYWIFLLYFVSLDMLQKCVLGRTRLIRNVYNQKCTSRLESALDTTLRRTQQRSGSGAMIDFSESGPQRQSLFNRSPHNTYEEDIEQLVSEYKQKYNGHKHTHGNKESFFPPSGMTSTSQVEVANLRVRIPHKLQWVVVDRCHFIEKNRTLDTKLEFPDLQISGRVIMHPAGGRCDMILRLRKAGIEFRTVPLIPSGVSGKSRQANVRTDSHFSEPGFISIFAHSCEGPTGIKYRINSKRRHFVKNQQPPTNYDAFYKQDYGSEYPQKRSIDLPEDDDLTGGDVFKLTDADSLFLEPSMFVDVAKEEFTQTATPSTFSAVSNSRTLYSERSPFAYNAYAGNGAGWQTVETNEALDEAYSNEIDSLFSKGVRGLLTTYMQKALQPAIKETLMESMGYTLSYG